MKKFLFISIVCLTFAVAGCGDEKKDVSTPLADSVDVVYSVYNACTSSLVITGFYVRTTGTTDWGTNYMTSSVTFSPSEQKAVATYKYFRATHIDVKIQTTSGYFQRLDYYAATGTLSNIQIYTILPSDLNPSIEE